MTGTFDNWSKSERLDLVGDLFQKTVVLPESSEKIFYKVGDLSLSVPLHMYEVPRAGAQMFAEPGTTAVSTHTPRQCDIPRPKPCLDLPTTTNERAMEQR